MYTKGEKNEVNGRCITHLHLIYIHPNYQNYFNLVMINPDIYYSSFFSETTKSGIPTSDVILEETYYTNAESFRFKWHYAPNNIYLRICSINMSPKRLLCVHIAIGYTTLIVTSLVYFWLLSKEDLGEPTCSFYDHYFLEMMT